jgi:hypothetical protein
MCNASSATSRPAPSAPCCSYLTAIPPGWRSDFGRFGTGWIQRNRVQTEITGNPTYETRVGSQLPWLGYTYTCEQGGGGAERGCATSCAHDALSPPTQRCTLAWSCTTSRPRARGGWCSTGEPAQCLTASHDTHLRHPASPVPATTFTPPSTPGTRSSGITSLDPVRRAERGGGGGMRFNRAG